MFGQQDYDASDALEKSFKSDKLMDIVSFAEEIDFSIGDKMLFYIWWNILTGKRVEMGELILREMGYQNSREDFISLLDRNNISYKIEYFMGNGQEMIVHTLSEVPSEIYGHKDGSGWWILMEPNNFKKSLMLLTTPRSREVSIYYLSLEKLLILYDSYIHQFNEKLKETGRVLCNCSKYCCGIRQIRGKLV
jgi:hypothetical protein